MRKSLIFLLIISLSLVLFACKSDKSIYVGDDISVALIIGERGDMSFNDTAIVGLHMAKRDHDINLRVLEHAYKRENFEKKLIQAAENGNNIIMSSSLLAEAVEENADKYPDTTFILYDGEVDWTKGDFENVVCISYKSNEASFLAGYGAAALSESDIIGVLAGMNNTSNNNFIVGYIEGAKYYNPDIKVRVDYIGNFADVDKARSLSKSMVDDGADVLFSVSGAAGEGLFETAEKEGKIGIGVDSDQGMMYEAKGNMKLANVIFTSVLKRVDNSLYDAIELYKNKELSYGETEKLGLKEEGVAIAKNDYYESFLDEKTRNDIEELTDRIISGDLKVESAIGKDKDFIEDLIDSVRP